MLFIYLVKAFVVGALGVAAIPADFENAQLCGERTYNFQSNDLRADYADKHPRDVLHEGLYNRCQQQGCDPQPYTFDVKMKKGRLWMPNTLQIIAEGEYRDYEMRDAMIETLKQTMDQEGMVSEWTGTLARHDCGDVASCTMGRYPMTVYQGPSWMKVYSQDNCANYRLEFKIVPPVESESSGICDILLGLTGAAFSAIPLVGVLGVFTDPICNAG